MSGDDNVIHVAFGRDGSHRRLKAPPHPEAPPGDTTQAPRVDDPLADLYDARDVARFFGFEERKLASFEKKGLVEPTVRREGRRYYTFRDLVALRALRGLLDSGVPMRSVVKALAKLRASLPRATRPLHELRVVADGPNVVVIDERGTFEPTTGQMVLDFSVEELQRDVVRVLRRPLDADTRRSAYEHYLEGCRLDEDPKTMEQAASAYLAALRLDPGLSSAITNLGNLRFRQQRLEDAERLYRSALAIDGEQPEAHYNLGFLELERDRPERAVPHLDRALELDPAFADAHFNLATALEALGRAEAAREHFRTYLALEPEGAWATIARSRLPG